MRVVLYTVKVTFSIITQLSCHGDMLLLWSSKNMGLATRCQICSVFNTQNLQ